MRLVSRAAVAAFAIGLSACATKPQTPVPLAPNTLNAQTRVGVVMTKLPAVDMNLKGAGCLLCIMAASAANSTLTTYTRTLPYEDLPQLKNRVAQVLAKKGANATLIEEPLDLTTLPDLTNPGPNMAAKDFSSLQKKYGIEKLLVIDIKSMGMERSYSAYIPNGPPSSSMVGAGYLINLRTNAYEWFAPVSVSRVADGNWDEPPKFPGLTNAYFQVLELGKDAFLKPLAEAN